MGEKVAKTGWRGQHSKEAPSGRSGAPWTDQRGHLGAERRQTASGAKVQPFAYMTGSVS